MTENGYQYFFATDFVWWAHHAFFGSFEALEEGDIAKKVDEFDYLFDDLGLWLIDEGKKAGESFLDNGELKNIYELKGEQEEKVLGWKNALEALSGNVGLDASARLDFLFCIECVWLIRIADAYDELITRIDEPNLIASYLDHRERFKEQSQWLQSQWEEVVRSRLPQDRVVELMRKVEETCTRLVSDWRDTVFAFARRYSSP